MDNVYCINWQATDDDGRPVGGGSEHFSAINKETATVLARANLVNRYPADAVPNIVMHVETVIDVEEALEQMYAIVVHAANGGYTDFRRNAREVAARYQPYFEEKYNAR